MSSDFKNLQWWRQLYSGVLYEVLWVWLASDLVESLNTAYSIGELSILQKRWVVTLIPKADSDTLKLTNWRPITLLNVNYKIASKAIATRIKKVLPQLIHTDKIGYMKDRFIGQDIRLHWALITVGTEKYTRYSPPARLSQSLWHNRVANDSTRPDNLQLQCFY